MWPFNVILESRQDIDDDSQFWFRTGDLKLRNLIHSKIYKVNNFLKLAYL